MHEVNKFTFFRSFANDIAIVEFEKAVTYKNGIQPGMKRYNLIKKHLIKFSNQILLCAIIYLFIVKRFNLVETFDNKWKFPTQESTMIHFLNTHYSLKNTYT